MKTGLTITEAPDKEEREVEMVVGGTNIHIKVTEVAIIHLTITIISPPKIEATMVVAESKMTSQLQVLQVVAGGRCQLIVLDLEAPLYLEEVLFKQIRQILWDQCPRETGMARKILVLRVHSEVQVAPFHQENSLT